MINNLLHVGKFGVIKDMFQFNNKQWKNFKNSEFYLQANWMPHAKERRRRTVSSVFNMYDWLDLVVDSYSGQLSSWFRSWAILHGLKYDVSKSNSEVSSNHLPRFLSHINRGNSGRVVRASKGDLQVLPTLFTRDQDHASANDILLEVVNIAGVDMTGLTGQDQELLGNYLVIRTHNNVDLSSTNIPTTYRNASGDILNACYPGPNTEHPQPSEVAFFKLNDVFSDFGSLRNNTQNEIVFRDMFYIVADLPKDYDNSFNNQSWLALTEGDNHEPSNSVYCQPLTRITDARWVVSGAMKADLKTDPEDTHPLEYKPNRYFADPRSRRITNGAGRQACKFIGSIPSDMQCLVKDDILDYEFTSDERSKGRGQIFIDSGDVCYCPLTGYPLKCVVDYRPARTNASGYTESIA